MGDRREVAARSHDLEVDMPYEIGEVTALEILDYRGRPTLEVTVRLADGAEGVAGVPSGASTGTREAVELRDGDAGRYSGEGVLRAVMDAEGEIGNSVRGRPWTDLRELDEALIALNGTPVKERLGANAVVGVWMAAARAFAAAERRPLYSFLGPEGVEPMLPLPHFNVINGGRHAQNASDFQEFMIAPSVGCTRNL